MKAIVIKAPGKPDALQPEERVIPEPSNEEVLIKVHAAGVNRPDVAQRKGHYPPPPGASDIPGLEVAGEVVRLGSGVRKLKVHDQVCALITGGGYAEYCVAPEGQCILIPRGFSFEEAASLPETFFTVWSNVFDRARLVKGESILIQGGSSGIGVAAIQLAKAFGATVYATAGTDEKCRFCKELGATTAINYKTERFDEVIADITQNRGVNVVLDMIGGAYTQMHLDVLAADGRLVLINFMKGDEVTIKLSSIMKKRLIVTGSTLRAREVAFKTEIARKLQEHVWPLLENNTIRPVIYKTFALDAAADAHTLMESSNHIGKIILTVS